MKVVIGESGIGKSYQAKFETKARCPYCDGVADLAFVAHELENEAGEKFVYELHENNGKGHFWVHDACSVAVYFCRDCLRPVADYKQA